MSGSGSSVRVSGREDVVGDADKVEDGFDGLLSCGEAHLWDTYSLVCSFVWCLHFPWYPIWGRMQIAPFSSVSKWFVACPWCLFIYRDLVLRSRARSSKDAMMVSIWGCRVFLVVRFLLSFVRYVLGDLVCGSLWVDGMLLFLGYSVAAHVLPLSTCPHPESSTVGWPSSLGLAFPGVLVLVRCLGFVSALLMVQFSAVLRF